MFSDGRTEDFDLIVGCDGIHSVVRTALHGHQPPRFTGNVCWRALVPVEAGQNRWPPPDVTIWTGAGGHVVTFYVRGGTLLNLVAVCEAACWVEESWSVPGTRQELMAAFPDVHDDIRRLLFRADACIKWGLFDRNPLPRWSSGHVTLLGDAAHPMLPFLGQGGAMAIEDAVALGGALAQNEADAPAALLAYEDKRRARTARVQGAVRKQGESFHLATPPVRATEGGAAKRRPEVVPTRLETDWLYAYDPI
jgi:salicylate hydroxylase